MNKLLLIGAIVGGYFLYKYEQIKSAISLLSISIAGANFQGANLLTSGFSFILNVANPTTQDLRFEQFIGSVFIGQNPLLNFQLGYGSQMDIKPGVITQIPMQVLVSNISLIKDAAALLSNLGNSAPYIRGNLVISGVSLPYSQALA